MRKAILISTVLAAQFSWAVAQRNQLGSLERFLFRPDLVMRHQEELQLTEEQRDVIIREVQQTQSDLTALHWDLRKELEGLISLMREKQLDETQILQQMDTLLDLENRVKKKQMILAIRIRNQLNTEQLATLRRLSARAARAGALLRERAPEPNGPN